MDVGGHLKRTSKSISNGSLRTFSMAMNVRFGSVWDARKVVVGVAHRRERCVSCGDMVQKWPLSECSKVLVAVVFNISQSIFVLTGRQGESS